MSQTTSAWQDTSLSPRERAEKLVAAMTLEQKIAQLHGAMETIDIYAITAQAAESGADMDQLAAQIQIERHVTAIEELGIPRFRITNGPVGVGMGDGTPSPPATSLPMTIGLAAGFDPELAHRYGDIIGSETATLGQHVLEGPGVCLHRTTIAGRNFEYFSEDPYLSGVMAVAVAKAIQAHDVIAMAKHYVVNDQEYERFRASVEVDEHVLRELYLLPFEMLVKDAEIAAIMSSYNRVRGVYATEYRYTLTDILRTEWGFDGYVQSDFWSCRSCAPSLNAGMDHEMPDAKWLNETNVKAALQDTSLEIETVDRALVRRYTQMFRFGQFERPYDPGEIDAHAHGAVSRSIGSQIAVLLKNDGGVLPLDADAGSIVLIGQSKFVDDACLGGGGSSKVIPLYTVTPLDGMQDVLRDLGSSATVTKVTVADDLSNLDEAKTAAKAADVVVLMAGLVATEGADQADANMLNDQNRMLDELLGINPDHRRRAEGQQPRADAVDRQGPGGAGGVEPGRRGRPRRRRPAVRRRQPLRQGADDLSQLGGRHPVRRQARAVSRHGRGRRLPGHPLLRRAGDRLPLVPGAGHRAAVRLRLRPVVHHLRHHRRVGRRAGRCGRAGHRDGVGDEHRPGGRRRGGAGVSRRARGRDSPPSDSSDSRRCSWSRGVEAGDDHHRPGGDEPPVRRLGLLHPGLRDQAGGVHRLRRQLGRQHAAFRDAHHRVRPLLRTCSTSACVVDGLQRSR